MQQYSKSAKKQSSLKLIIILLASFIVLCLVGSTLAWFTDIDTLTGNGSTPYAKVNLYSNGLFVKNASGSSSEVVSVNGPVFNKNIESTDTLNGNVQFNCSGSNIDLLAVASIYINFYDSNPSNPEPNNNWVSLNINSNWIKGDDGRYYYNSKITKSNASSNMLIFDTITINNSYAIGKTLNITVYIEVVQANQLGLSKLQTNSGINYTIPDSFASLV